MAIIIRKTYCCDMCGKEIPDEFDMFQISCNREGTESYELCSGCARDVELYIKQGIHKRLNKTGTTANIKGEIT